MKVNSWKDILKAAKVTVQDLADYLGCHKVYLTSVLTGKREASKTFMYALKRAFGLVDSAVINWRINPDEGKKRKIVECKGLKWDALTEKQRGLIVEEEIDRSRKIIAYAARRWMDETINKEYPNGKIPPFVLGFSWGISNLLFVRWLELRGMVASSQKLVDFDFSDADIELENKIADEMQKRWLFEKEVHSGQILIREADDRGCLSKQPLKNARPAPAPQPAAPTGICPPRVLLPVSAAQTEKWKPAPPSLTGPGDILEAPEDIDWDDPALYV